MKKTTVMIPNELIDTLKAYAEWAEENIYEVPVMLPDVLLQAAYLLEDIKEATNAD